MSYSRSAAGASLRGHLTGFASFILLSMSVTGQALANAEDTWSAAVIAESKAQRGEGTQQAAPRRNVRVAALGRSAYSEDTVAEQRRPARGRASSQLIDRPRSIRNSNLLASRPQASRRGASARQSLRSPSARRVASLGRSTTDAPRPAPNLSAGGGIRWVASAGCLAGSLRSVVASIAANFGPVTVTSTCRSHAHNRRVGGARRSLHLTGNAVDFRVHGRRSGVMAFLRSQGSVGGIKHYGGGLFHIDTGARRGW